MNIATATLPTQPRAHSFREGQRILGISRSTFYRLEAAEKIKLLRIGRRTLIPASEIERLLKEGVQ
jgi:excisionase family DNA binding protein